MAFCKNCGAELSADQKFCANCGSAVESAPAPEAIEEPAVVEEPVAVEAPVAVAEPVAAEEPVKAGLNVGMLVWSIINLLFCCQALGIASLILTIMAKSATSPEDEAKKIKSAKICNIIGTVGGVIIFAVSFIIGFLGGIAEAMG